MREVDKKAIEELKIPGICLWKTPAEQYMSRFLKLLIQ